jgi:integrase
MSSPRSGARKPTPSRKGISDSSPLTPWSIDRIDQLLTVARRSEGTVCGIPSSQWWPAFLLTMLDTTLCRELLAVQRADYDPKTGRLASGVFVYALHPRAADFLNGLYIATELKTGLFPLPGGPAALARRFQSLLHLMNFQVEVNPIQCLDAIRAVGVENADLLNLLDLSPPTETQGPATTLTGFAAEYPTLMIELKKETADNYAMCARLLTEFHGHSIALHSLSVAIILPWLKDLTDRGKSATTVNSYRGSIITLWRAAAARNRAPAAPNKLEIPKRRVPRRNPLAWTPQELELLLEACERLTGQYRGGQNISLRDFWTSLILFLYETGARIGAAVAVTPVDINLEDRVVILEVLAAKTKTEQRISFSEQTATAIRRIYDPKRATVWPSGRYRKGLYARLKQMLKKLGLTHDRRSKFHRIRRTTATQTALHGTLEMAQRQLGHTSLKMTLDAYIDPRALRPVQAVDVIPALHVRLRSMGGHDV